MMKLDWQRVELVKVEAKPVGFWNLALDYVSGPRLLRLRVVDKDEQGTTVATQWSPVGDTESGADGTFLAQAKASILNGGAQYGALIGKIGGSSADLPDSTQTANPYGNKKVFAVGSYCVVSIASSDSGPLFLTMNDHAQGFKDHTGILYVLIEEYLL